MAEENVLPCSVKDPSRLWPHAGHRWLEHEDIHDPKTPVVAAHWCEGSLAAKSEVIPPSTIYLGAFEHGARVYEPVPRWWQRSHWWKLGRFSGGWSPIHSGLGPIVGYSLHLLRGKRLHIEIRWTR